MSTTGTATAFGNPAFILFLILILLVFGIGFWGITGGKFFEA